MFAITGITGQVGGVVGQTLLDEGSACVPSSAMPPRAQRGLPRAAMLPSPDDGRCGGAGRAHLPAQKAFSCCCRRCSILTGIHRRPASHRRRCAARDRCCAARPRRLPLDDRCPGDDRRICSANWECWSRRSSTLAVPVTFLRPGWFLENIGLGRGTRAREPASSRASCSRWTGAFPMVATRDVGRYLLQAYSGELDGPSDRRAGGPDPGLSPNDLAASLCRGHWGGRSRRAHVPRDHVGCAFREQGMRNPLPRTRMLDGFNEGWIAFGKARWRCGEPKVPTR